MIRHSFRRSPIVPRTSPRSYPIQSSEAPIWSLCPFVRPCAAHSQEQRNQSYHPAHTKRAGTSLGGAIVKQSSQPPAYRPRPSRAHQSGPAWQDDGCITDCISERGYRFGMSPPRQGQLGQGLLLGQVIPGNGHQEPQVGEARGNQASIWLACHIAERLVPDRLHPTVHGASVCTLLTRPYP